MRKMNQKGFTLIEVIISMAIISVVLFVGYMVLNNSSKLVTNQVRSSDIQNGVNIMKQNAISDIKGSTDIILHFKSNSNEIKEINVESSMKEYKEIKQRIQENETYDYSYIIKYKKDTNDNKNTNGKNNNNEELVEYEIKTINKNKRIYYSVNRKSGANINLISKQEIEYDNNEIPIEIFNDNGRYEININSVGSKKNENYRFDVFSKINDFDSIPKDGKLSFMMDCLIKALRELGWNCKGYLNGDTHDDRANCTEIKGDVNNGIMKGDLKDAFENLKKIVCIDNQGDITKESIKDILDKFGKNVKPLLEDGNNGHNKAIDEIFKATLYVDIAYQILELKDNPANNEVAISKLLNTLKSLSLYGGELSKQEEAKLLSGNIGSIVSTRAAEMIEKVSRFSEIAENHQGCTNMEDHKYVLDDVNIIIRDIIEIQTLVVKTYSNKQEWPYVDKEIFTNTNTMIPDLIQLKHNLGDLDYISKAGI